MGNDFPGVISQVGSTVRRFKVGDEIYARATKNRIRTFAECIAINENTIALKSKNLSFVKAASMPLIGLISYQVFNDMMTLQYGRKILI